MDENDEVDEGQLQPYEIYDQTIKSTTVEYEDREDILMINGIYNQ